jgi:hypothetical protein
MEKRDIPAVLMRDLRVSLINVSPAGILVASDRRMAVGTLGRLRLRIGQEEFIDDIAVVRCQSIEGAGTYHVAMRFMFTTARQTQSIRRAITQHITDLLENRPTTRFMTR